MTTNKNQIVLMLAQSLKNHFKSETVGSNHVAIVHPKTTK